MQLAKDQKTPYEQWRNQQGQDIEKKISDAVTYFKINSIHIIMRENTKITVLKHNSDAEYTYDALNGSWTAANSRYQGIGLENLGKICVRGR